MGPRAVRGGWSQEAELGEARGPCWSVFRFPQQAMSRQPRGLRRMSLVLPCALQGHLSKASVRHGQAAPQQPLGPRQCEKALNPFPARAPELLVCFLQLLGEL